MRLSDDDNDHNEDGRSMSWERAGCKCTIATARWFEDEVLI